MKKYSQISCMLALFALSIVTFVGCGPTSPSRSEFTGEVVTEVPKVPGANKQYPMPELDEDTNGVEQPADTTDTEEAAK